MLLLNILRRKRWFYIIIILTLTVMGSLEHSLSSLILDGSLRADGESFGEDTGQDGRITSSIGPGGGSGGTVLFFIQTMALGYSSMISTAGGQGSPGGGGGGGGGRVHFHWSNILVGDEYIPIASVNGSIITGLVYKQSTLIITCCICFMHLCLKNCFDWGS